jgi:hypothetical protein
MKKDKINNRRYNSSFLLLFLIIQLLSCSYRTQQTPPERTPVVVNPGVKPDTILPKDSLHTVQKINIRDLADTVLTTLVQKDYHKLATYVHPVLGVRFSPYGYIDTSSSMLFTVGEIEKIDRKKIYHWGSYDGSGEPIRLSMDQYFDRFVCDAPFNQKGKTAIDKILGTGNSKINIREIYPHSTFVEYFIPGMNPDYRGLDWKSLRLVFAPAGDKLYLVAVVHDSWTI